MYRKQGQSSSSHGRTPPPSGFVYASPLFHGQNHQFVGSSLAGYYASPSTDEFQFPRSSFAGMAQLASTPIYSPPITDYRHQFVGSPSGAVGQPPPPHVPSNSGCQFPRSSTAREQQMSLRPTYLSPTTCDTQVQHAGYTPTYMLPVASGSHDIQIRPDVASGSSGDFRLSSYPEAGASHKYTQVQHAGYTPTYMLPVASGSHDVQIRPDVASGSSGDFRLSSYPEAGASHKYTQIQHAGYTPTDMLPVASGSHDQQYAEYDTGDTTFPAMTEQRVSYTGQQYAEYGAGYTTSLAMMEHTVSYTGRQYAEYGAGYTTSLAMMEQTVSYTDQRWGRYDDLDMPELSDSSTEIVPEEDMRYLRREYGIAAEEEANLTIDGNSVLHFHKKNKNSIHDYDQSYKWPDQKSRFVTLKRRVAKNCPNEMLITTYSYFKCVKYYACIHKCHKNTWNAVSFENYYNISSALNSAAHEAHDCSLSQNISVCLACYEQWRNYIHTCQKYKKSKRDPKQEKQQKVTKKKQRNGIIRVTNKVPPVTYEKGIPVISLLDVLDSPPRSSKVSLASTPQSFLGRPDAKTPGTRSRECR